MLKHPEDSSLVYMYKQLSLETRAYIRNLRTKFERQCWIEHYYEITYQEYLEAYWYDQQEAGYERR